MFSARADEGRRCADQLFPDREPTGPSETTEANVTETNPNNPTGKQEFPLSRAVAIVAAGIALVAVLGVLGWVAAKPQTDWAGTVLAEPLERPSVELIDTEGNPVNIGEDDGQAVTLLMFGYTNCPDICPISLATLTSTLKSMDPAVARNIRMVFVTADPERDTPEVLGEYLQQFDPTFIGLTGSPDQIIEAQTLANVPPAVNDDPDDDGDYAVGHATQMIAYQKDGTARIVYPFGTRESDWARDLPRLVNGDIPEWTE